MLFKITIRAASVSQMTVHIGAVALIQFSRTLYMCYTPYKNIYVLLIGGMNNKLIIRYQIKTFI